MSPRVSLAYGSRPLEINVPEGSVVVEAPTCESAPPLADLLERALDQPLEAAPLERVVRPSDRVLIIVSDHTRADPRGPLLNALHKRLPTGAQVAVAVANGTHEPRGVRDLGLPDWVETVIDHDSRDATQLVELGTSARGTPFRVNRAVLEADWIIATGSIRPHYFAGFGAGVKALFPGLGEREAIRINHRLKLDPTARPGCGENNACRDDLESILEVIEARCFLLDTVETPSKQHVDAVAGDVIAAFREGARRCAPHFRVTAEPATRIVVSDHAPITDSLYQASKMAAMAAPLCLPGGVIVLVAECRDGVEPVDVVNRAIYEIGIRPRLPPGTEIRLVSSLEPEVVAPSYCRWFPSVEAALEGPALEGPALVIPDAAGSLLYELG